MRASLTQNQRVGVGLEVRVDPRVILSSQILQLNSHELESAIDTELDENPALERLEDHSEALTDESILKNVAPYQLGPNSEDSEFRRTVPLDDKPDWLDCVSSSDSLWDHVRAQLLPTVPQELQGLAAYLVECIDERGYLGMPIEEVALETDHTLEQAEQVWEAMRRCDPAGVGATNLQDCLMLQLRGDSSVDGKLARLILRHHIDELVSRNAKKIARRYRVPLEVVQSAFEKIQSLNPYPADGFDVGVVPSHRVAAIGVTPDLSLLLRDNVWEVHVHGADPTWFSVARAYRNRMSELNRQARPPKDEKRHIGEYIVRAETFIQCLSQRRKTMMKIGEYLVRHQAGFVSTGRYQFLAPLTRSKMATEIGLHESTVSRATMGKFVQIATGEVVSFDVFFKPALRVQKMIEEIMATENPMNPLSDDRIAALLAKKGVQVARRTVSKYRHRTKLLSSHRRRTA